MPYYIDTESLIQSVSLLAQATYGDGGYGSEIYSDDEATTPVDPGTPTNPETNPGTDNGTGTETGVPGFPNTGIFAEQPILLVPVILAGAVLIATIILVIKRTVRRI